MNSLPHTFKVMCYSLGTMLSVCTVVLVVVLKMSSFQLLHEHKISEEKKTFLTSLGERNVETMVQSAPAEVDQYWYEKVIENIAQAEYDITFHPEGGVYQSPNRKQDLRFTYQNNGFCVEPRVETTDRWTISQSILSLSRGSKLHAYRGTDIVTSGNKAEAGDQIIKVLYQNTEEGMRQDFVIAEKMKGDGPLQLTLRFETSLHTIIGNEGIVFTDDKLQEKMRYSGLKVWDANGKILDGNFEKGEESLAFIIVDDKDAVYPITIDPLSSTENWSVESNQANAGFGVSVSGAGDVNGDGFSDVIIGAFQYDNGETDEGRAYVFLGSVTGLSSSPSWTAESNQADAYFGISVSDAGDVNGDGYSDIIVGSRLYDNGQIDEGMVFVYHGSAVGLSATASWTSESNQSGANYGNAVSAAGDVNGDGYADVIIGAYGYDGGNTDEGRAYVFLGSGTGLSGSPVWTGESDQTEAYFGTSVSGAGDVNGDGYGDIVVGAHNFDNGQSNEGAAFVFHGSVTGVNGTSSWMGESNQAEAYFGNSVSTAGDVNGDGYSDVIIGSFYYDNGQANEGAAFVYHGSASGLSASANSTLESNQNDALFGRSVSLAGDINGDGFADVIVGADWYDNIETDEGRAFLFLGTSAGVNTTATWTSESNQFSGYLGYCVSCAGDVNGDGFSDVIVGALAFTNGQSGEGLVSVFHGYADGLSASTNWTALGGSHNTDFGYSVSTAGDVNGDGFSDVIIGAYGYDGGQTDEGRAYVYYGSSTGLPVSADWTVESNQASALFGSSVSTAGDVNGDGYSDVIVGAPNYDNEQADEGCAFVYLGSQSGLSGTVHWTAESNQIEAFFGRSVSTAGDVNGDGYSDVIVSAPNYNNDQVDEGRAFVYHGSPMGLSLTAAWTTESNQNSALLGWSVSTAGDVNGDGFSDVVVGAAHYDNGQSEEGQAYLFYGSASGLSISANWTYESNMFSGYLGWSVSTAGDVNGDGYSDVIIGAYGATNGEMHEGRAYIFHGSSSGLPGAANWIGESNQANAYYGWSVSSAGDVNGDGYSDVIVGSPNYQSGEVTEGGAFLYLGSITGLSVTADWMDQSNEVSAYYGWSVSTAGDVNGDGFSDVVVGAAQFDGAFVNQGKAYIYYGNSVSGKRTTPRQFRANLTTPVAVGLKTRSANQVGLGLFGRTFFGRSDVKIQFEVKPFGSAFNGSGTTTTSSWTDIGTAGLQINQLIGSLSTKTLYKWRARVQYRYSKAAPQTFSRWIYGNTNGGLGEADFQVADDDNPLPVELTSFKAVIENQRVILSWQTVSEVDNFGFSIERRLALPTETYSDWSTIGFVQGNGNSNSPHTYRFVDEQLLSSVLQYRLKQIDNSGAFHYSEILTVQSSLPVEYALMQNYPNPFNPSTLIEFALPKEETVSLKVYNAIGEMVAELVNSKLNAGYHRVLWNASALPAGIYFCRMSAGTFSSVKKLMFIK